MMFFAVRLIKDKQAVGFFVAEDDDQLREMVDEVAPTYLCEFQELGAGGFIWEEPCPPLNVEFEVSEDGECPPIDELKRGVDFIGSVETLIRGGGEDVWEQLDEAPPEPDWNAIKAKFQKVGRPAFEPPPCTIYFIGYGDHVKIGLTNGPVQKRLKGLSTGCPYKLTVHATIENASGALELELHQRFAAHRLAGEWFRLAPEILAYIEEVKARSSGDSGDK
jgi:hypothetical protein